MRHHHFAVPRHAIGVLAAIVLCAAPAWAQKTIYVARDGDDLRTGEGGWTNAVATIASGVSKSDTGDTVLVSNGVYNLTVGISISKGVTVQSRCDNGVDRTNTIINGQGGAFACVTIDHAGAVLDGFTITNGGGRGVLLNASGGTLCNSLILNNATPSTDGGGGIYITKGMVSNCIVAGNSVNAGASVQGGGIKVVGSSVLIVDS